MKNSFQIIAILLLLCTCKKDHVVVSPFIVDDFSFLLGNWQWKKAFVNSNGDFKCYLHKGEVTTVCTLTFEKSGTVSTNIDGVSKVYQIRLENFIKSGNDYLFSFIDQNKQTLIFTYSSDPDVLHTTMTLFKPPTDPCYTAKAYETEFKRL